MRVCAKTSCKLANRWHSGGSLITVDGFKWENPQILFKIHHSTTHHSPTHAACEGPFIVACSFNFRTSLKTFLKKFHIQKGPKWGQAQQQLLLAAGNENKSSALPSWVCKNPSDLLCLDFYAPFSSKTNEKYLNCVYVLLWLLHKLYKLRNVCILL